MISFLLLAQLSMSEPQQTQTQTQTQSQSTYRAPKWQQPQTQQAPGSVPSRDDIEDFEQELYNHPNG